MFSTLRLTIIAGALVALLAASVAIYVKGRSDGRAAITERLKDDRITILKDGKEIDHEVDSSDDDALCALIGGCGVPDDKSGD